MRKMIQKLKTMPIPRLLKNRYFLTAVGFVIWIWLIDAINLMDWISERTRLNRLEQEQRQLEQDIQSTQQKINAFANPDSLEKIAREQFYFVGPGEVIFIIEEEQ
ncbi:MAG: septum formation initiator family protein [Prevotellaceae bacterium]|jgi:cell division protein FtsB|nr:septum formation initiator family protein [Prevotellaceae bacterium]